MNPFPCEAPVRTESGWTIQSTLTADNPFLRGHFPGRPILPAVAQLALLTQAANACASSVLRLTAVNDLRFRSPLLPGAQIVVRLNDDLTEESSRFSIHSSNRPVCQGSVSWTRAEPIAVTVQADIVASESDGQPILLPQEAEARYIRGFVASDETAIECLASIPNDNAFRSRSGHGWIVPAFLGLEMGAQTAATHEGVIRAQSSSNAKPVGGYVVRCRQAKFAVTEIPAEAQYRVTATCVEAAPPLRTYKVTVSLDRRQLVEGLVSTFAEE